MKTLQQIIDAYSKLEETSQDGVLYNHIDKIKTVMQRVESDKVDFEDFQQYREDAWDKDAFDAYVNYQGWEYASNFDDTYRGEYDTLEDYTEEYIQSTGILQEIPENLRPYFDVSAFAKDLSYDLLQIENGWTIYFFDNY